MDPEKLAKLKASGAGRLGERHYSFWALSRNSRRYDENRRRRAVREEGAGIDISLN